jgi:ArsR family transcriptional regulator, arsenate/arsenite/antimonite-responsive transcriptional repressor
MNNLAPSNNSKLRAKTMVRTNAESQKCCTTVEKMSLPDVAWAEDLAKLTWALAHPARVRIVRVLLSRTSCMCGEIVDEMPLAQSTVSQHLKILKETGLVQGEIDGPRVCYCINKVAMAKLKKLIANL